MSDEPSRTGPMTPCWPALACGLAALATMVAARAQLVQPGRPLAASAPAASAPAASTPAEPQGEGETLAGLISSFEALDRLRLQTGRAVARAEELALLEEDVRTAEERFAELLRHAAGERVTTASRAALFNLGEELQEAGLAVDALVAELRGGALSLELVLGSLQTEAARWEQRAAKARSLQASEGLVERMQRLPAELKAQSQAVRPHRDRLLGLLERASQLRSRMAALDDQLRLRRQRIGATLRNLEQEPLWRLLAQPRWETAAMRVERMSQWHSVQAYLGIHAPWLFVLGLAVTAASGWLLRGAWLRLRDDPLADRPPLGQSLRALQRWPWAALLLGLMAVALAAPHGGPVAFYDFGAMLVPIPAGVLAVAVLGPGPRFLVWGLTGAALLVPLRSLIELDPLSDRLKTIAQLLLVIVPLSWSLAHALPNALPARVRGTWRIVGGALLAGLLVSLYATVVGHVGLSRTLRGGILGAMAAAVVLLALYHALLCLGLALLRHPTARASSLVRRRGPTLERAFDIALRWAAATGVAAGAVLGLGLGDDLPGWFERVGAAHVRFGEANLPIGSMLVAAGLLLATYLAVVVLRVVLEDAILPRLPLKPGVPFAISALARYSLAVAGFLFALAAAGIDLGKVTLVAGAIGVGVGLGLQSIVGNFVSGLILLVEQPVHVGDAVETGTINGVVRRIGFRASVIRTAQGADAIVPNGDLLSRQMINWTRWDRQRRIDIDVRVPYGSDPAQVVDVLQRTAGDHAGVQSTPGPQALFLELGENALLFRLMAWVYDGDAAGSVGSELRGRILERLGATGIAMPPR